MARPIWSGTLSFGLLNIPVSLMSGERRTDISFRMLDARSNTPIRYERVNAETGAEVPWKDIVKAFEYSKGNYVVVDQDTIKSAAPESHDAIEVEAFVERSEVGPQYFEKPYVLVPAKKAEKGYVLLREALADTDRIGIARVVIRTREHLCAIMPDGPALFLMMMRYPQELVDASDYALPDADAASYRISKKELEFSRHLIDVMSTAWRPEDYVDEFRERLQAIIQQRIAAADDDGVEVPDVPDHAATNVVDFMALLKKSIEKKGAGAAGKNPSKIAKSSTATKPRSKSTTRGGKSSTRKVTPEGKSSKTTGATRKAGAKRKSG